MAGPLAGAARSRNTRTTMTTKRDPRRPPRATGKGSSEPERPVRLAVQLRQEMARLIGRELSDPRLEGLVISNAWVSADLQLAKIFFRIATIATGAQI